MNWLWGMSSARHDVITAKDGKKLPINRRTHNPPFSTLSAVASANGHHIKGSSPASLVRRILRPVL